MMMERLLSPEGPVFSALDKVGRLILLSILWIIGCIPVVTICTSNAALYYAVAKSVRHGQGSVAKEFLRGYREAFVPGICMTVLLGAFCFLVEMLSYYVVGQLMPSGVFLLLILFAAFEMCYAGPVLSRFRIGVFCSLKLCFVMSVQFAHYTLLFLLGTILLVVGQFLFFPIAMMFILPGAWCWISSFLMERVLLRYMPAKEKDDMKWYYEN